MRVTHEVVEKSKGILEDLDRHMLIISDGFILKADEV
jgi:hypothetical protein